MILGVLNARDDIDDGQRPRERWFTQLNNASYAWFLFQDLVVPLDISPAQKCPGSGAQSRQLV